MIKKVIFCLFLYTVSQATIYDCHRLSPNPSEFFETQVTLECDFDIEGKPKLVILSGSSRLPLNTKALYTGPDNELYERFQMTSRDGVTIGISAGTNMFPGGSRGAFLSYEPHGKGGFWNCYFRE